MENKIEDIKERMLLDYRKLCEWLITSDSVYHCTNFTISDNVDGLVACIGLNTSATDVKPNKSYMDGLSESFMNET